MKYLITVLLAIMFIINGCDKKPANSNNNDNNLQSYSTENVKENTDYFNFSTNSGSTDVNSTYDIKFYSVMWNPTGAPPDIIINDPRFQVKNGLSIAVIENTALDDVTEVPNTANFITDFVSEEGEWYSETSAHIIIPIEKVYIVNTADGKFPVFQIQSYYHEMTGDPGYFNIEWKYLSE